jgi:hypothetical protein
MKGPDVIQETGAGGSGELSVTAAGSTSKLAAVTVGKLVGNRYSNCAVMFGWSITASAN